MTPERVPDADVRYITFSSGTTGRPKGIFGSHKCVHHMNTTRQQLFPYDVKSGRWTVAVNIFLLWGVLQALGGLKAPAAPLSVKTRLSIQRPS